MPDIDLRDCTRREPHSTSGPVRRAQRINVASTSLDETVSSTTVVGEVSQRWVSIQRARPPSRAREEIEGSNRYILNITNLNSGTRDITGAELVVNVNIPYYATRDGDVTFSIDTSSSVIHSQGTVGSGLITDITPQGNNNYLITFNVSYVDLESGDIVYVIITGTTNYIYYYSDFLSTSNQYLDQEVDMDYSEISSDGTVQSTYRYSLTRDSYTIAQDNREVGQDSQYTFSFALASEKDEDTGLYKIGYLFSVRINGPDAQASSLECTVDHVGVQQQAIQSSYQGTGSVSVSGTYNSPSDVYVTTVRSPIVRVELDKSSFPTVRWTAYSSYAGGPASGGSFDLSYFVYESSTYYTYHWNVTVNGTNLPSVPGVVSDQIIYVNDKQLNAQTYYQGR